VTCAGKDAVGDRVEMVRRWMGSHILKILYESF
jgi:hypothetical protein